MANLIRQRKAHLIVMQTAVCAIGRVKEETVKNKTGQHSNNAELQKAPQVAWEVYFKLTADS
ncbi:MAG: hypothetical protein F6K63_34135 [Moorea sp. SIO1G6]|uniref:hypothetical protein n=1 Tax=Moorena sp. SIO1G6 TaxID=2607840 RepID=UPI0013BEF550|nr:hypothetical protein [Moorena sp. SIO1G6]NET69172.1 hypothetical protein [Moorena sp. SIO1G6]